MEPWKRFVHSTEEDVLIDYQHIISQVEPSFNNKTSQLMGVLETMPLEAAGRHGAKHAANRYLTRKATSAMGRTVAKATLRAVPVVGAAMLIYDVVSIVRILSE